jgi:hypothetical protein
MIRIRIFDAGAGIGILWAWRGMIGVRRIHLPFSLSPKTWQYGVRHGGWLKAIRGGGFV